MDMHSSQTSSEPTAGSGRIFFVLVLLLALAGFGVSIELTNIHHATHTDPSFESICAVSDAVNCETVARSPYSIFLGAPVSVWGIFGYILITIFAAWGLSGPKFHPRYPLGIIAALTAAALAAAGVLGFISFTRIDSICLFCMTLYGINSLLTLILIAYFIRRRINPLGAFWNDFKALLTRPLLLGGLAVPIAGAAVTLMLAIPPYWQHVGWREIPTLPTGSDSNGFHWIGAKTPLVTIIEFSDYQCPFCRKAHKDLRLMAAKHPNEVRVIHRHLPLDEACNPDIDRPFHGRACDFAKAAECAAEQERFWEMNDALFSIQDTIKADDVDVEMLAVELGLDRSSFKACMARPGTPTRVKADMAAAKKKEIMGTPTFFIGAQPYEGHMPESVIVKALEKANKAN